MTTAHESRAIGAPPHAHSAPLIATALAAIGVVFGDIGTSPLYTLQVAAEAQGSPLDPRRRLRRHLAHSLGADPRGLGEVRDASSCSADNRGEGGILALLALLPSGGAHAGTKKSASVIALLVIAGAALLFGDGMITPAISVLSALEGLELAAPGFKPYVVPLTCVVLLGLFSIQRRGTGSVGRVFGPVMVVVVSHARRAGPEGSGEEPRDPRRALAALGCPLLRAPRGRAGSPSSASSSSRSRAARPSTPTWATSARARFGCRGSALVAPGARLSYLGQGALILRDPGAREPVLRHGPHGPADATRWSCLAAMATTIASQALISGVFSLTHQAVQLGYFPRVTDPAHVARGRGSDLRPPVNWWLMIVVHRARHRVQGVGAPRRGVRHRGQRHDGDHLARLLRGDAEDVEVARRVGRVPLLVLFLSFDLPFFGANLIKFVDGGVHPDPGGHALLRDHDRLERRTAGTKRAARGEHPPARGLSGEAPLDRGVPRAGDGDLHDVLLWGPPSPSPPGREGQIDHRSMS